MNSVPRFYDWTSYLVEMENVSMAERFFQLMPVDSHQCFAMFHQFYIYV
jgi:hypothetical protein